jgi:hypothetical protein
VSAARVFNGSNHFLYRSLKILLLIIIVVTITVALHVLIAVLLRRSLGVTVPSVGTIHLTGVEVYGGDIRLVDGVASIDWGTVQFGDSRNVSFYLRSTSNEQTRLAFNVTDWSPEEIKNYVKLSWNYSGTQLAPKQEILVIFTLSTVDTRIFADYLVSNNVTSYNFKINIHPTE